MSAIITQLQCFWTLPAWSMAYGGLRKNSAPSGTCAQASSPSRAAWVNQHLLPSLPPFCFWVLLLPYEICLLNCINRDEGGLDISE